jgi:acyl dehydratase
MRTIENYRAMEDLVGEQLVISDWHMITQDEVNQFASVTGDHQWIHVDQQKSEQYSPYGKTIAHGYFVLSLVAKFFFESVEIKGVSLGLNYGLNKVRFTHAVPIGSRVRAHFSVLDYLKIEKGARIFYKVVIEIEGQEKPACVAETISQVYQDH